MPKEGKPNAPCMYEDFDPKTGEIKERYPSVDCNHQCYCCGWNPEEKERRLETGIWKDVSIRFNPYSMRYVQVPPGVQQLSFVRMVTPDNA